MSGGCFTPGLNWRKGANPPFGRLDGGRGNVRVVRAETAAGEVMGEYSEWVNDWMRSMSSDGERMCEFRQRVGGGRPVPSDSTPRPPPLPRSLLGTVPPTSDSTPRRGLIDRIRHRR